MVRAHKPPQRPVDLEGECPYDSGAVKKYSTKCIWYEKGSKSWHDGDVDCGRKAAKLGIHIKGYLMSFHNVHDVDFIMKKFSSSINGGKTWIGMTTNRAGGWMWSDSTAVQVNIFYCIFAFF